ncbi:cbb3-type cytochrome oxidase assembly protein CcoS [Aurantimonas sp. C2-6-R+9]|uniref:cbb3-type cytochrome oxidase assembly protein CcoS n=1 Tax=unclassified Aurantimonas TaxID=2638230 RepID=UPI002E1920E1|nr:MULTISPECIES: cbb3-type cytochrome oxidase assembly protein CcoS [unclassified Aurantimonas]MEC5291383.1 cbb3-type cytochrome oxidase assembly protein CcoS [Aurantimonas sp. C2-3-R2]MEC5381161.1 cbb3-type cytochrome oxidase assembly protein CcoS [Aurantimonas sp. C2-6-R+9]MEC5412501.1 cbb3-type cytochrome oxidase assembly protein CcoS [Aurantimonas sp. C2-4-R8]
MNVLIYLLPVALGLGMLGLAAFLWSLKSGQYEDLDGAAERILLEDDEADWGMIQARVGSSRPATAISAHLFPGRLRP